MEKKQTALQWYIEQCENIKYNPLEKNGYTIAKEKITKQALEMEKEQIVEAYQAGDGGAYSLQDTKLWGQEFYNEIYGGNNDN